MSIILDSGFILITVSLFMQLDFYCALRQRSSCSVPAAYLKNVHWTVGIRFTGSPRSAPPVTAPVLHAYMYITVCTGCFSCNALDLCSGGTRFESQPGHQLSWLSFRGFPAIPGEYWDFTSIREQYLPSKLFSIYQSSCDLTLYSREAKIVTKHPNVCDWPRQPACCYNIGPYLSLSSQSEYGKGTIIFSHLGTTPRRNTKGSCFYFFRVGWDWVHLVYRPLTGLLY
jgi:hypothetical protein